MYYVIENRKMAFPTTISELSKILQRNSCNISIQWIDELFRTIGDNLKHAYLQPPRKQHRKRQNIEEVFEEYQRDPRLSKCIQKGYFTKPDLYRAYSLLAKENILSINHVCQQLLVHCQHLNWRPIAHSYIATMLNTMRYTHIPLFISLDYLESSIGSN
jgi:hypothetical protein